MYGLRRKWIKFVSIGIVLGGLIGGSWIYKFWWGKPDQFNLFVERATIQMILPDPELISNLGIVDHTIFDFFSDKLTNISYKQNIENQKKIQEIVTTLHRYDREQLSVQEKLTFDVLNYYLESVLASASFRYGSYEGVTNLFNPYPVNQFFGMQSYLPDFMVNIHQVTDLKSAERYIARLSQWEEKFQDLIAELKLREQNGVVPPRFVIEKVLEELHQFIQMPVSENLLFTSLRGHLGTLSLPMKKTKRVEEQALKMIQEKVYPAYLALIGYLEGQIQRATFDAGVWKFPNGEAYYAQSLRFHTTTSGTPDQIHALGLSEVARIRGEMRQILDQIGYRDLGIKEAMQQLGKDSKFLYPNTDEGRAQILSDFHTIFEQSQDKLSQLFTRLPKAQLKIEAVPAFKAKTAPVGYYEPGDLKGARPGVFYANTYNVEAQTKFTMPTLAYHEGLPGHHLQISLAQEITDLPFFRKVVGFNAYVEGWALYCEQLASEFHFTSAPEHDLGRLQFEMMRAVRLVVDTGIHHKRWTREQAIEYMADATGQNKEEVMVEIDRYIVIPGQACSYKIGMIKLLELREKMRSQMGAHFDIKKFHDFILENGALPLSVLEDHLTQVLKTQSM